MSREEFDRGFRFAADAKAALSVGNTRAAFDSLKASIDVFMRLWRHVPDERTKAMLARVGAFDGGVSVRCLACHT